MLLTFNNFKKLWPDPEKIDSAMAFFLNFYNVLPYTLQMFTYAITFAYWWPAVLQFHGEEQRDEGDEPAIRWTEVPCRHGAHLCHPG